MLVPICMIHLFHLNEVKFNFLKKLLGSLCFDLDHETEVKLNADKLEIVLQISSLTRKCGSNFFSWLILVA